jgi:hypothetical protein
MFSFVSTRRAAADSAGERAHEMNGEIAQLAALAAHAKIALALGSDAEPLTMAGSSFRFVHAVRFEEKRGIVGFARMKVVAQSPQSWCIHLRDTGVRTVSLRVWAGSGRLPDHVASAFAGGGNWGIETSRGRSTSLWTARWSPDRRDDPERRIWSIVYRASAIPSPSITGEPLETANARLRDAVDDAERFAREADLSDWASGFAEAALRLSTAPAKYSYHPDMLPRFGYGIAARQLLAAAERAWVFGGMGSWNDLGFSGPERTARYEAVTTALYRAVTAAIAAAVNSFPA